MKTPDQEEKMKQYRFFKHLSAIMTKNENNELINLTEIYEDHGCPKYQSPKRRMHYPRGKQLIQHEIERNNNEIEKVIKYDGKTIYGNYNLALAYLREIDAYNTYLFIDFLMKSEPNLLEKYLKR